MLALSTEVQNRVGTQYLTSLTNPGDPSATGISAAKLDLASTDVQADFEIIVGVLFDVADIRHVSVGVEGVLAKLIQRTGQTQLGDEKHNHYIERLQMLREIADPGSKSELTPIDEKRGMSVVRPKFDDSKFDRYVPESPVGDTDWPNTLP